MVTWLAWGLVGSVLGRFVLGLGALKWAELVPSSRVLAWTPLSKDLGF